MGLSKSSQLIESVFAGGGDMGARMRAFDWSTTDLGPVAQWPHSLRAGVRIVLAAGHPMLISWGPDYTMLYNDAYEVVLGTRCARRHRERRDQRRTRTVTLPTASAAKS